MSNVIVWDIETVPDIKGFAAANGQDGKNDAEIRVCMGDNFPSTSITQSSASVLWLPIRKMELWAIDALGARRMSANAPKRS